MIDSVGIGRIGVTSDAAPYDWEGFKKYSNVSNKMIKGLVKAAKDVRANPQDWRVSFTPVANDKWVMIQIWELNSWIDFNTLTTEKRNK